MTRLRAKIKSFGEPSHHDRDYFLTRRGHFLIIFAKSGPMAQSASSQALKIVYNCIRQFEMVIDTYRIYGETCLNQVLCCV